MTLFSRRLLEIDLLPDSVQKPKQFKGRIVRLVATQAIIILCLAGAVIGAYALERRAWDNLYQLTLDVNALRHGQELAATQEEARGSHLASEDAFLSANAPAHFDPVWVTTIIETGAGNIRALDYNEQVVLLTGQTDNINEIDVNRQNFLDTGLFSYVGLGTITLQEDGRFVYELRLTPRR